MIRLVELFIVQFLMEFMFKFCPLSFLISQSSNFEMSGVKNLVVMMHNLPIIKIVDDLEQTTSILSPRLCEPRHHSLI